MAAAAYGRLVSSTPDSDATLVFLQPPGPVSVEVGDRSLTLRWTAAEGAVGYRIYRRNADGTWPGQPLAGTTELSFSDLTVENGVGYAYRVAAVDEVGNLSLAQEAAGKPGSPPRSSRTFLIVGVFAVLLALAGAYLIGHATGTRSGLDAGQQRGYRDGRADGVRQTKANYAKGQPGYTSIYEQGYEDGQSDGTRTGKSDGRKAGYEEGVKAGKQQADKALLDGGEPLTYTEGQETATLDSGFADWQADTPYLVLLGAPAGSGKPFSLDSRQSLSAGFYYYLCPSSQSDVCRHPLPKKN